MQNNLSRNQMNYLNMTEIRSICRHLKIPIHIHIENSHGEILKTSDIESKSYLLDKIFLFLNSNVAPKPIIYKNSVVSFDHFKKKYLETDLVLFNDFKSTNKILLKELKNLTSGEFKFGALAFIEAHLLWREGKVVTLKEFSKIWLKAVLNHQKPLAEWAYLTDLQTGFDKNLWKEHRVKMANQLMNEILGHFS